MSDPTIPLAEVIQRLREELLKATQAGKGHELRLRVEKIVLELEVGVTKGASVEGGAEGGVSFWVFDSKASAKAAGSYESSRLQRITLELEPHLRGDGAVDLSVEET